MSGKIKLLVVEDSEDDAALALHVLRRGGFEVESERVDSAAALRAALGRPGWDAIVSDYNMPGFSGMEAFEIYRGTDLDIPFILVSGTVGEAVAVAAMTAGVSDFVMKGNLTRLAPALDRGLKDAAVRAEHRRTQHALHQSEQGLHRAQQMANLAYVISGSDGSFESWSATLPLLIGAAPADMPKTTRAWLDWLHPDDRSRFRNTSIEAGQTRSRADFEYRLRRADGTWIRLRQVMEPLDAGADGAIQKRWFNTMQDVTSDRRRADELRESEARFRALTEMSTDFYWETDTEHRLSRRESGNTGESEATLKSMAQIGKRRWEIPNVSPDAAGWQAHRATLDAHLPFRNFELSRRGADGAEHHLSISGDPVIDSAGAFLGYRGVGTDITARKAEEMKIRRLNRIYAMLSGINAAIVRIREREALFREVSRVIADKGQFALAYIGVVDAATQAMTLLNVDGADAEFMEHVRNRMSLRDDAPAGYGPAAMAIRQKRVIVVNDVANDARIVYKAAYAARGIGAVALLPLCVAGEAVAVLGLHASEVGFFDAEEMKLLTEVAGDISFALENLELAKQLDYQAYYDTLTGLANRALFHDRTSQYLRIARQAHARLAMVLVDIERFKTINDSLGRQAGDEVLKQVADRLGDATAPANVARISGNTFSIVLPDIEDTPELDRRMEQIWQRCFAQPYQVGDTSLRLAAKSGIALYPADGEDSEALFGAAEAALEKARQTGERHQYHSRELSAGAAERFALENRLRQALDNDEFVLHYQPKVDAASGRTVGLEALIRWQSPELGLVPPMKFIPLMEETGLILPVGVWALQRAARDHRAWTEQGLKPPRVAVNVSPIQLRQGDFVSSVEAAILEGVAPTGIDLEITESLIMANVEDNVAKLKAARSLGVRIAIDDFGTGYSSLSYLTRLPVQSLKIDRSFIITMLQDAGTMTLVQAIISMAHSLKLKVVAEGVDAEAQAAALRALGCDEMQGYLFSKPLPFEQITGLLAQPALVTT